MKIIVRIDFSEQWPVLEPRADPTPAQGDPGSGGGTSRHDPIYIEIDETTLARWERVAKKYDAAQEEMRVACEQFYGERFDL